MNDTGILWAFAAQYQQMANMQNASQPQGRTITEKLKWKKYMLEANIKRAQADLEAVTAAIAKLDAAPELDKALEALSKAGVL